MRCPRGRERRTTIFGSTIFGSGSVCFSVGLVWSGRRGMTVTELADLADLDEMIELMTVDSIGQGELAERLLEQAKEGTSSWSAPMGCWAS